MPEKVPTGWEADYRSFLSRIPGCHGIAGAGKGGLAAEARLEGAGLPAKPLLAGLAELSAGLIRGERILKVERVHLELCDLSHFPVVSLDQVSAIAGWALGISG